MRFSTTLVHEEQIAVLRAYLMERAAKLPNPLSPSFFAGLDGQEEKSAARLLRERLFACGISLKHTHALTLIGQLAGRNGWHGKQPPWAGHRYKLMVFGLGAEGPGEVTDDDPAKLLSLLAASVEAYVRALPSPAVATLRRNSREIMVYWEGAGDLGFVGFLQVQDAENYAEWLEFSLRACERIRRVIEEAGMGFCDGYIPAVQPAMDGFNVEISVMAEGGYELGRGTELRAFSIIEGELERTFSDATTGANYLEVGGHRFYLDVVQHSYEPRIYHSTRTFFQSETEGFIRRYQQLSRRLGTSIGQSAVSGKTAETGYGIPENVPVNWKAVEGRQTELGLHDPALANRMDEDASALTAMRAKPVVKLGFFVKLAQALEAKDFNTLVKKPSWQSAVDANEEPVLRSLLHVADDVRFYMGQGFSVAADEALREAAEDLAASRRARDWNRSGQIAEPLNDMVFFTDAGEFLDVAQSHGAVVQGSMIPVFLASPELELPAVGRRLVLIVAPSVGEGVRRG